MHTVRPNGRLALSGTAVLALAAAVFWLAFDHGSYALTSRQGAAVAILWALLVGSSVSLFPVARVPMGARVTGGLLALFAVWTGLSALWAASPEKAFVELDRVLLYLAIFALAAVAAPLASIDRWLAGMVIGLTAVSILALTSRLFPHLFDAPAELAQIFPSAQKRLSYPVDYWNGLATLGAFAVSLLLYFATRGGPFIRALAVAPFPALAAMIYLASSRGGTIAAALAAVLFVALTGNRWGAAGALLVGGLGATAAIAALLGRDELVDTPFQSALAESQGRSAAVLILLLCLGSGLVYGVLAAFVPRPRPASRAASTAFAAFLVALGIVAIVAAHPIERLQNFKEVPRELQSASVQQHLLSGSGNGRWQLWEAGVEEFQTRPLVGRGAGSYEAWWAEHGTLPLFVRDAHSLYVETLGEIGVVGLLLLAGLLGAGVVVGLRRLAGGTESERAATAALLALLAAYLFEAGIDWMWELTAVSAVAMLALGLLTGPATDFGAGPPALRRARPAWVRPGLRVAAGLVVVALAVAQAIPLLATMEVSRSQEAATRGDLVEALAAAESARSIQSWAATPYLQLALVEEVAGDIPRARAAIESALVRDDSDWRLWLVAARLQTKAGAVSEARQSLARAKELNPRSPLFAES